MTYNPEVEMPRNLEEYNILVNHFFEKDVRRYAEEVASAKAQAEADYAALPDEEKARQTLAQFVSSRVATVPPAKTKAEIEDMYAFFMNYNQDVIAIPEPDFDTLKKMKLSELTAAFDAACDAASVEVNGLVINANETANRNVEGLIKKLEAEGSAGPVSFCLYDNSTAPVTLDALKAMQLAIISKGQELYAQKWAIREQINAAQDKAALDAVIISFAA